MGKTDSQRLALKSIRPDRKYPHGSNPGSSSVRTRLRPVAEIVFPAKSQPVLGLRAAPELQARIQELAAKSTEGTLTDAERSEYEGYVRANKFVAILKRLAWENSRPASFDKELGDQRTSLKRKCCPAVPMTISLV
jgi:hypothetical protein